ncbi:MAG: SEC-C metal-binding domain-containing protein, partial [Burkholderiales bacterium]
LLDFPRERHRRHLADLAARQPKPVVHFSPEDVEEAYARGRDEPDWTRFDDPWKFYARGAIARRRDRWAEENAEGDEDALEIDDSLFDERGIPYLRQAEKIGRNDPCPCGSGKKYKKCCLRADET